MKIGILGTGDVGQALGIGFANLGHDVKMGSRDPNQEKVKDRVNKAGSKASAGTFAEAAAYGELAVLCCARFGPVRKTPSGWPIRAIWPVKW